MVGNRHYSQILDEKITGGKPLLHIVDNSNVFLQHLLRLKNDIAAIRRNVDLVPHERVYVIHILDERQSPRNPRQT